MPTAVERLFNFLKLNSIDSSQEQLKLSQAFALLDRDFFILSHPGSGGGDQKFDHKAMEVVGDAFVKLATDFRQIGDVGIKLDEVMLKIQPPPTTTGAAAASVDGAPNFHADFLKLDQDLKLSAYDLRDVGLDFLKLSGGPGADGARFLPDHKIDPGVVGDAFHKLGEDMAADRLAFLKLSDDFLTLGDVERPTDLQLIYKELGGDLRPIADTFDALASDFLKLGDALKNAGDGSVRVADGMAQLNQDFLKLDDKLLNFAHADSELIGLLRK